MKDIRDFAERLCRLLIRKEVIREEEKQIYQYGIECGMILALNFLTALLLGILTGKLDVILVFLFFYITLRSYSGGFHLESKVLCYFVSSFILLIPVYTYEWFMVAIPEIIQLFTGIAAVLIIWILSPAESKNKRLDFMEMNYFRRISRCVLILQVCILTVLYCEKLFHYCYSGYSSMILIAIFLGIGRCYTKYYI